MFVKTAKIFKKLKMVSYFYSNWSCSAANLIYEDHKNAWCLGSASGFWLLRLSSGNTNRQFSQSGLEQSFQNWKLEYLISTDIHPTQSGYMDTICLDMSVEIQNIYIYLKWINSWQFPRSGSYENIQDYLFFQFLFSENPLGHILLSASVSSNSDTILSRYIFQFYQIAGTICYNETHLYQGWWSI